MPRQSSILRGSMISAIGTGLSRVFGAVRDIVIGHVFGAGRASDAFWLAWTVPSLFRRFVADEGLTGALIPAVAHAEHSEGQPGARRLAGAALAALIIASALIIVGGMLSAPWLVKLLAWGFARDPEKLALTITLTRWLFPFVVFVSLVSFCEGLLNHRGHFFVPKLAPGLVSACIAAAALLLATRLEEPVLALAIGALTGGLVHLLVCVLPLIAIWGVPRPSMRGFFSPRFRAFLGEMGKVVAIGITAQVNVVLLRVLATLLEEGSVTQYQYAVRVVDLAQGAVAVAVGSALLPAIAQDAAARDWQRFRQHFAEAAELVAVVLVPAALLLLAMAVPIMSILFRHGEFDPAAIRQSAATLRTLVPFMLALAGMGIVKKVYFALDERTTLVVIGAIGVAVTGGFGYLFSTLLGVEGLGLALSLAAVVQLGIYLIHLRYRMRTALGMSSLARQLSKMVLAALLVATLAWVICESGDWSLGPASLRNWLLLSAAFASAALVYLGLTWWMRVPAIRRIVTRMGRLAA